MGLVAVNRTPPLSLLGSYWRRRKPAWRPLKTIICKRRSLNCNTRWDTDVKSLSVRSSQGCVPILVIKPIATPSPHALGYCLLLQKVRYSQRSNRPGAFENSQVKEQVICSVDILESGLHMLCISWTRAAVSLQEPQHQPREQFRRKFVLVLASSSRNLGMTDPGP